MKYLLLRVNLYSLNVERTTMQITEHVKKKDLPIQIFKWLPEWFKWLFINCHLQALLAMGYKNMPIIKHVMNIINQY